MNLHMGEKKKNKRKKDRSVLPNGLYSEGFSSLYVFDSYTVHVNFNLWSQVYVTPFIPLKDIKKEVCFFFQSDNVIYVCIQQ